MSMIEKVARAIHGADWKDAIPSFADESWDESRANYMALARAAIEAMREPTEEMMMDAEERYDDIAVPTGCGLSDRACLAAAFTEAIDAALEGEG